MICIEDGDYDIWIEAEEWPADSWDADDANTDVIVTHTNGNRWVASFFTYRNILTHAQKNERTRECLSGKYLWSADMILINAISRAGIEEVIHAMVREGTFEHAFAPVR